MNQYPPGFYVSEGKKGLPPPGPDSVLQTVEVDAGPWGWYRITYVAVQNPRQGMRHWFWTMHAERVNDFATPMLINLLRKGV